MVSATSFKGTLHRLNAFGYNYHFKYFECRHSLNTPVFIFNGFLQSMDSWNRFIKYLIGDAAVIIADLPGSGTADPIPAGQFDLDMLAECTKKIMDETSLDKIDIISASFGAGIAFKFARNYPDSVHHLMLAGIMNEMNDELRIKLDKIESDLRISKSGKTTELVVELLLNSGKKDSIRNFWFVKKLLIRQLKNLSEQDKKRYYANYQHLLNHPPLDIDLSEEIKKLVFTGEFDHFTKPEYGRSIAQKLTNSIFTTIKNADHLFHLEQLDTTAELVRKFFRDSSLYEIEGITYPEMYPPT